MGSFWRIVRAIAAKELRQIARDRLTAALLVGVPLAQILLFGYAIDLAPRAWPTAWVGSVEAPGPNVAAALAPPHAPAPDAVEARARQLMQTDGWFRIDPTFTDLAHADAALQRGELSFIVVWPPHAAKLVKLGERPAVRLIADLSDPFASAAVTALRARLADSGPNDAGALPVDLQIDTRYAASSKAGAYLVPALAGVILTLTLTLLAALAIVREVERGTWHGLLTTPAGPAAIVLGKLLPYLGIGAVLFTGLVTLAHGLFGTAFGGPALWVAALLFMLANLGLGLTLSFIARTQMQAMQMGVFFYLPSILLSGFMFPFHAMPAWARGIGEALPLTHFLRCLRASLLRGADAATVLALGWPIAAFALVALAAAWVGAQRRSG
jgi:ABC-2 type transport system permease protein